MNWYRKRLWIYVIKPIQLGDKVISIRVFGKCCAVHFFCIRQTGLKSASLCWTSEIFTISNFTLNCSRINCAFSGVSILYFMFCVPDSDYIFQLIHGRVKQALIFMFFVRLLFSSTGFVNDLRIRNRNKKRIDWLINGLAWSELNA